jgi:AcrR family transcriptional regulator
LGTGERRVQLLELGRKLFNERSYDEISIDDVAAAAGISKGLLYHYFSSKRVFYVEIVRTAATEMIASTAPPPQLSPTEQLDQGLDAYLDYVENNAKAYGSLLRSGIGTDVEVERIVERTRRALMKRIIQTRVHRKPPPSILRIAVRGWIGFVEAAVLDWLDRRDLGRPALRAMLAAALASTLSDAERVAARFSTAPQDNARPNGKTRPLQERGGREAPSAPTFRGLLSKPSPTTRKRARS